MFLFFPPGVVFCLKLDFWNLLFYLLENPLLMICFSLLAFVLADFEGVFVV